MILSGRRFRFDLDRLLGNDPAESIDVEAKIGSYSHFDEKDFTRKQRLYKKYPDDDDVRIEYRQALLTKLTHVTLLEDMAWARAGVDRPFSHAMDRVLAPADHVEAVEEKINQVATEIIPDYVQQRGGLMMLGMAKNPLLLPGSADTAAAAAPVSDFSADAVIAQAQRNFQQRSKHIKEIASQKSQLLEEILPLLDVEYLTPTRPNGQAVIHLLTEPAGQSPTVLGSFTYDEEENGIVDFNRSFFGQSVDVLKNNLSPEPTHITVTTLPEITDIMMPVNYVCQTHARILENAPITQANQAPPRPDSPEPRLRQQM